MNDYPSIDRLAELQQLIADFAKVERVPQLPKTGRPENDVEHSFGLALTCWFLQPKIAPHLDLLKILKYALSHDLVEIHAGDTFAFGPDKAYINSKDTRERDAIELLRRSWQDFIEPIDYAEAYMDKSDDEAKFVKAIDKILPLLIIDLSEGEAYWRRYGINEQNLRENKKDIKLIATTEPYFEAVFDWLDKNGNLPKS